MLMSGMVRSPVDGPDKARLFVLQHVEDGVRCFFSIIVSRSDIKICAPAVEHEMIHTRGFPAGPVESFGNGLRFVATQLVENLVLLFLVLGVAGDACSSRISARHERSHIGSGNGWEDVFCMSHADAFGDQLLEIGGTIPLDIISAKTVRC